MIACFFPFGFSIDYETVCLPVDILSGSPALRQTVDARITREALDEAAWWEEARPALLYE